MTLLRIFDRSNSPAVPIGTPTPTIVELKYEVIRRSIPPLNIKNPADSIWREVIARLGADGHRCIGVHDKNSYPLARNFCRAFFPPSAGPARYADLRFADKLPVGVNRKVHGAADTAKFQLLTSLALDGILRPR